MVGFSTPSEDNNFLVEHIELLITSFKQWTKKDLIQPGFDPVVTAEKIFHAPFAVMSHNTANDPIFNYANQTTLRLFNMTWEEFIQFPSRNSTELDNQTDRSNVLDKVLTYGVIENYSGKRISSAGRRFQIQGAVIWNVIDCSGQCFGQAAMFKKWKFL